MYYLRTAVAVVRLRDRSRNRSGNRTRRASRARSMISNAMARWLGIDHGSRRIGIAICDSGETLASPLTVIDAGKSPGDAAERVLALARAEEAEGIVVGHPLNMDGSRGPQAVAAETFAAALRKRCTLPVELFDERLSSYQADLNLAAIEAAGGRGRAKRDALAAQVILQSFLDSRQRGSSRSADDQ